MKQRFSTPVPSIVGFSKADGRCPGDRDPLPDGQAAQHIVGQVACQVGHAPPAARGTKSPSLAREGDQDLVPPVITAKSGEATCEYAAREELSELPLDELG